MTGTSLTAKKKDKNLSQDITRLKGFSPWAPIETFGLGGLIFRNFTSLNFIILWATVIKPS